MVDDWGIRPNPRRKLSKKDARDMSACGWGIRPSPERALLKARFKVGAMANSDTQEALSPPLYPVTQIRPLDGQRTQHLGNLISTNTWDETVQKRCVPTP